jgi:hypothetical protein
MAEAARRACVVLCCASGVGGRHRILRQGRERGGSCDGCGGGSCDTFLAGERRMLCSQMSRRRTLVRGIGVRPHFFLALDFIVCYFGLVNFKEEEGVSR